MARSWAERSAKHRAKRARRAQIKGKGISPCQAHAKARKRTKDGLPGRSGLFSRRARLPFGDHGRTNWARAEGRGYGRSDFNADGLGRFTILADLGRMRALPSANRCGSSA